MCGCRSCFWAIYNFFSLHEQTKKKAAIIKSVLGHPDRLRAVAQDFVAHYEARVAENAPLSRLSCFFAGARPRIAANDLDAPHAKNAAPLFNGEEG